MKAFERQYKILKILNERREVTVGYLAKEFNVSEKTVFRDIWFLSGFLPIRTIQGRYNGGVSFMDDYRYCDFKFYMTNEQVMVIRKIIDESVEMGVCYVSPTEIIILSNILKKYQKITVKH